ncbi:SRPBCC domain-containing protein [Myxococcus sp. K15C18031901]|uniref:SRPBCC domain-containing protein n=1 Tax=Myxococcus dinghuensis TaxID=2906761 RepID=UPI0020A7A8BB|nr:SRPBCC domain-containing protein [Myxococcus dinghuensis]MCP3098530.1 SRPBCC domain-containing protein [Myxococcus dinghuensis]
MELKFQVQLKVQKPVSEVFDAVVNPRKLSGYFVQAASAPLIEGTTVKWRFAEVPGEHDVVVREVRQDERIVFEWEAAGGGYDTRVEMKFKVIDAKNTLVQVSESGWREDPVGQAASYDNCGGWMHMMLCLKAYLEHGINLRAGGAF